MDFIYSLVYLAGRVVLLKMLYIVSLRLNRLQASHSLFGTNSPSKPKQGANWPAK
jgi:hypothetical protein